ncbi:MAG: NFACT family protein, partial [Lachnospiraceae bacterium]|nr:NFACT family protein [Lachnospiraceae bacterium]
MAFDGITIACMVHELSEKLVGGRITKISQPEKEEVLLTVKSLAGQHRLFISASASLPLIYLTEENKPAPMTAPNFCMVLRKYLQGGRVVEISQPGLERVIQIKVEHLDEMGDTCIRVLCFELMGKYSNLILCDDKSIILDSLKHVSAVMSSVREVLPQREYFIPVTVEKKDALTTTYEEFAGLAKESRQAPFKMIYQSYTGISPFMAREMCNNADVDDRIMAGDLEDAVVQRLYDAFDQVINKVKMKDYAPCMIMENAKVKEFAVMDIPSYPSEQKQAFDSVSKLLFDFYASKNKEDVMRQKSLNLRKTLQTILERDYKKLDLQKKQLQDAGEREKYKIYGELLNAYGYQLQDGVKEAKVLNYYTNEEVTIPLDETLSIKENAVRFFDKYGKMKRTEEALAVQTKENEAEIAYLESVQTFLNLASTKADLQQIQAELSERGFIKKSYDKKNKKVVNKPLHYVVQDEYDIYVGKNNLQNEEV